MDKKVWFTRIRAAVIVRREYQEDMGAEDTVIIALTDALQSLGY